jgi:serine/threonine-protein kinase
MIGRTLSHFKGTAGLGEGAMGEVWRATDASLNREVAVKLLPAEMATDPERLERFKREALAIAALNHPNIVTIYSVEEAEGVHFLTMELVEGTSLDQMLPARGFDVETLLGLGSQIADALAAAHRGSKRGPRLGFLLGGRVPSLRPRVPPDTPPLRRVPRLRPHSS